MIDIRASKSVKQKTNKLPAVLFAALCFVVWDSGYYKNWIATGPRDKVAGNVTAALLIKAQSMTNDQKYTANSPVIDEIADQRNVLFRVIDEQPGELSGAPDWLKKLFLSNESNAPCLAVLTDSGKQVCFEPPSSVAEFRERIGAK